MARFKDLAAALSTGVCVVALATPAQAQDRSFNVPSGPLRQALDAYVTQSGNQLIYRPEDLGNAKSKGVTGMMPARSALERVLAGTGFKAVSDPSGALAIVGNAIAGGPTAGNELASSSGEGSTSADSAGISEILVVGSRSQNVDIRRSENGPQPYVIFDSDEIQKSKAANLEEFLVKRLSSNSQQPNQFQGQIVGTGGAASNVDLRGLGSDQTLILVDGRRRASVNLSGDTYQQNIRGIPIEWVDRIEVLPSTAGGIYGANAIGGVVNIVLKHNLRGVNASFEYGNSTRFDAPYGRLSLTGGLSFNEGRTSITGAASFSRAGELQNNERDILQRLARQALEFGPNYFSPDLGGMVCSTISTSATSQSCNGANLVLDNGTALGSNRTFIPAGYQGPQVAGDGGNALVANAGQLPDRYSPGFIWAPPSSNMFSVNVRQEIGEQVTAYLELSHEHAEGNTNRGLILPVILPAASPFNPFQQNIIANMSLANANVPNRFESKLNSLNAGIIVRPFASWSITADYSLSRSKLRGMSKLLLGAGFTASGTLRPAALQDTLAFPLDNVDGLINYFVSSTPTESTLSSFSLRAGGPLFSTPGGRATLNALLQRDRETLDDTVSSSTLFGFNRFSYYPTESKHTRSGYAEIRLPLVSAENSFTLVRELELIGSIRRDHFNLRTAGNVPIPAEDGPFPDTNFDNSSFSATSFTVASRYSPIETLTFRGSYNTGFAPPQLIETVTASPSIRAVTVFYPTVTDPRRGNTFLTGDPSGNVTFQGGGNPNLGPEKSHSSSYGVLITPPGIPGLRASIDVTRIKKKGEIVFLNDVQDIINNETELPDRVVRGANLATDPVGWAGPIVGIDASAINLYKTNVRVIDVQLDYALNDTRFGDFHFYARSTYQDEFRRQITTSGTQTSSVAFIGGPLKWRANFGLDWSKGGLSAGWNAQYYGSYKSCFASDSAAACGNNQSLQGSENVGSQTLHDLYAVYKWNAPHSTLLNGLEIGLSIQNVFDTKPHVVVPNLGYSSYVDARLRRFVLSLKKSI